MVCFRKLNEILPEEFSASYKRLVKQDFTDTTDIAGYLVTNAQDVSQENKEQLEVLTSLLTQINMTRDSMDEDEDILQMNLSVVGSILLEFTNALSEHMVSMREIDKSTTSAEHAMTHLPIAFVRSHFREGLG
jgi:hypothetical protein